MKIAYVITKSERGGAQANVLSLAKAALAAGHEVRLITGHDGWLCHELVPHGVTAKIFRSLRRSWNPADSLAFIAELRSELRARPADVVHCHSSNTLPAALIASSLPERPRFVFTVHGLSALHPNWKRSALAAMAYKHALKRFLPLYDRTVFVSNHDRGFACGGGLVSMEKSAVIHNGIAADRFELADRAAARARLAESSGLGEDLPDDRFLVGFIGRLDYAKQVGAVLTAADKLRDRGFAFILGGYGPDRNWLEMDIEKRGLHGSVRMVGEIESTGAVLPGFDCFVLPSRFEGFPYVLLEAGLARLPVVASAVGGIPELIENNRTGRLISSDDHDWLAREIAWCADHPAEAAAHGQALNEEIVREFTESRMAEETLRLYAKQ